MNRICILILVCAVSSSAFAQNFQMGVMERRNPDMLEWHEVVFHEDHRDRQPNQPPRTWTNLTFAIPYWARGVQITALDAYNSIRDNEGARTAETPFFNYNQYRGTMNVSFVWWGVPWTAYLGLRR